MGSGKFAIYKTMTRASEISQKEDFIDSYEKGIIELERFAILTMTN